MGKLGHVNSAVVWVCLRPWLWMSQSPHLAEARLFSEFFSPTILGIFTMLLCHMDVARGGQNWGYHVQGSHRNYNNKTAKQYEKEKKTYSKCTTRVNIAVAFLLKWLHSPSVFSVPVVAACLMGTSSPG